MSDGHKWQSFQLRKRRFDVRFRNAFRIYRYGLALSWWTAVHSAWRIARL